MSNAHPTLTFDLYLLGSYNKIVSSKAKLNQLLTPLAYIKNLFYRRRPYIYAHFVNLFRRYVKIFIKFSRRIHRVLSTHKKIVWCALSYGRTLRGCISRAHFPTIAIDLTVFSYDHITYFIHFVCVRGRVASKLNAKRKKKTVLDIIKVSHFTLLFLVHAQYCGCDFRIICMGMVKKDSISHVSDCCSGKCVCVCVCMASKRVYNNQKQTRSRLLRSRNVYNTIQVHLSVYVHKGKINFFAVFFFEVPSQMYTNSNIISTHNNHQV